jgi:hypothetical protein
MVEPERREGTTVTCVVSLWATDDVGHKRLCLLARYNDLRSDEARTARRSEWFYCFGKDFLEKSNRRPQSSYKPSRARVRN